MGIWWNLLLGGLGALVLLVGAGCFGWVGSGRVGSEWLDDGPGWWCSAQAQSLLAVSSSPAFPLYGELRISDALCRAAGVDVLRFSWWQRGVLLVSCVVVVQYALIVLSSVASLVYLGALWRWRRGSPGQAVQAGEEKKGRESVELLHAGTVSWMGRR